MRFFEPKITNRHGFCNRRPGDGTGISNLIGLGCCMSQLSRFSQIEGLWHTHSDGVYGSLFLTPLVVLSIFSNKVSFIFTLMCMCVLSAYQISSWCPQRSEEGVRLWNWSYKQFVSYHEDAGNRTLIFERTVNVLKLWAPRKGVFFSSVLHTVYLDMMLLHRIVWTSMLQVQENQRLSDSLYWGTGFDTVSGTEPTLSPASEENSGQTAKSRHSWAEVSCSFKAIPNVCKLLHTWDARGNDGWQPRRTAPLAIVSQFSGPLETLRSFILLPEWLSLTRTYQGN